MLVTLPLLFACAYTVRSLTDVSPGGGPGEFYALVRTEYWQGGALADVDATVIRCTVEEGMTKRTTCQAVLTGDEALTATDREVPITFTSKKGDK